MQVRSGLNEESCRSHVVVRRGPHQRGLTAPPLLHLHIGAVGQQHLDDGSVARPGSRHQDRLAVGHHSVGVGTRLQQSLED